MNAKSFFCEKGANLQFLEKLSPYIGVSDKFFLKSVKSLNRIFWVIEYWLKFLEYQIWSTNTKLLFLEKWENSCNSSKDLSLYWNFLQICFEVCQNPNSIFLVYQVLVQGFSMPNLVGEYKIIFVGRQRKAWDSVKTFSLYWYFL